jgi:hypothetical protein
MKVNITFKPIRNAAVKTIRIINKKTQAIVKPVAKLKQVIWRGLQVHIGSAESFRERLHRRATAPFHFFLPGLKPGKA